MNDYVMRILIRNVLHAFLRIKDCSVTENLKQKQGMGQAREWRKVVTKLLVNDKEMNQNSKKIQQKETDKAN